MVQSLELKVPDACEKAFKAGRKRQYNSSILTKEFWIPIKFCVLVVKRLWSQHFWI